MRLVKTLLLLTIMTLGVISAASYLRFPKAAPSGKYFDHIVIIAMENQDESAVIGNSAAPFINSLAAQGTIIPYHSYEDTGGSKSGCSAACYVFFMAGDSYGVSDGYSAGSITGTSLPDQLTAAGLTWQAFCAEGCGRGPDHFPFLGFASTVNSPNLNTNAVTSDFVTAANSANPPNFLWYTPTDDENMHSSSVSTGDTYLKNFLVGSGTVSSPASGSLLASSLFTNPASRTMLELWWDEYDPSPNVHYGSMIKVNYVATGSYGEYEDLHTIEGNWGLTPLAHAAGAALMTEIFSSAAPTSLSTSFTASPSPAQANQSVTFTASTVGGTAPYSDSWSFGDGSTATGSSTTHTFTSTGTFQVKLTSQDSANPAHTASSTRPVIVNRAPLPGALSISISYSPPNPTAGQTVTFRADASSGTPPYGVGWDFGDGSISVGTSTTHIFSSSGTFNVTAAVTDSGSPAHSAITSTLVSVGSGGQQSGLSVQFSFQPSGPKVGDSVSFTSSVSGGTPPYTYAWDFGDSSGASTVANPSYSYSASGTFTVTLNVQDSAGASQSDSQSVTVAAGSPSTGGSSGGTGQGSSGQYCSTLSAGQSGDLEPILSVDYVNPANSASFSSNAIFDSGSAYSLAPNSLASSLGLTLSDGSPVTLTTATGGTIQAVVFHLDLNLGGSLQVVNVPVAFTDSTNQFLIGRIGFLGQVSVTFDANGQTICLNAGSPSTGSGDSGGGSSDCSSADEDDPDGDSDDCGQAGDSGDSGDSGSDFLGIFRTTTGGVMSGLPMLLMVVPFAALTGVVFHRIVKPTRQRGSRRSTRRR